jgi:hypothetical protein
MIDPVPAVPLSAAETPQGRLLITQSGTTPMMLKLKGGLWPRAKRRSSVALAWRVEAEPGTELEGPGPERVPN